MKQRINLTIDPSIFKSAQRVAKSENSSVSEIVERYLKIYAVGQLTAAQHTGEWLDKLRRKYLPKNFTEPTDEELKEAYKTAIRKKYKLP